MNPSHLIGDDDMKPGEQMRRFRGEKKGSRVGKEGVDNDQGPEKTLLPARPTPAKKWGEKKRLILVRKES